MEAQSPELEAKMGEEWKDGCYQQPLEDCLRKVTERWRCDRNASWANQRASDAIVERFETLREIIKPLDKQEVFKAIEQYAECIMESSQRIGASRGLLTELSRSHDYHDCEDFLQYTNEGVQTHLAEALVASLGEAASRLVDLAAWEIQAIEDLRLSESAKEFLRLVTNCYVWGFNAPCIIICRSAIEEVLRSKLDYETCEKHLGARRGRQPGFHLADYIEVARRESLISDKVAKEAHTIRERANKVLHNDPKLTEKTGESIGQTVRILCMIETGEDPWHVSF